MLGQEEGGDTGQAMTPTHPLGESCEPQGGKSQSLVVQVIHI